MAAQSGPEASCSTAARHARILLRQHDLSAAVSVLVRWGVGIDATAFETYRELALEVLGAILKDRDAQTEACLR